MTEETNSSRKHVGEKAGIVSVYYRDKLMHKRHLARAAELGLAFSDWLRKLGDEDVYKGGRFVSHDPITGIETAITPRSKDGRSV